MIRNWSFALSALAIMCSAAPAFAGDCATQIVDAQIALDSILRASAAVGPEAYESSFATMHRQPTPHSIAQAEERLGELPPETAQAFRAAMRRARVADVRGDAAGCATALEDARAVLGQPAERRSAGR